MTAHPDGKATETFTRKSEKTMLVEGKTLSFDKNLWVQYGGVEAEERGDLLAITGRDEDSFLKIFNHFGRVLKIYIFEDGRWLDADTGSAPVPLDEFQAGHLPGTVRRAPAAAPEESEKPKTRGLKSGQRKTGTKATSPRKSTPAKKAASPAKGKSAKAVAATTTARNTKATATKARTTRTTAVTSKPGAKSTAKAAALKSGAPGAKKRPGTARGAPSKAGSGKSNGSGLGGAARRSGN